MIILDLINNIALLVALAAASQVIEARWHMCRLTSQFLYGLLFGAVGVVGMLTPVRFLPGIIFDGRSIILSVGGLFGGPVVALISALMCGAYRLWLGGAGVAMGLSVILESAALGVAFHYWRQRRMSRPLGLLELWAFGLLVHGVMLGLVLLLRGAARQAVWDQLGLAIIGVYPVATVLICRLFLDYEKQRHDRTTLEASEARHRTTLHSIGDAVIATDAEGRVELLNPVAETLTGWRQQEARGQRLDEVFRILNEDTRQAVESPVEQVLREGLVVGLANHTLLVAKDGAERPIADAGAPIRDEQNQIIGVVLVFRDQTRERAAAKALRESEERFRTLFEQATDGMLLADAQTKRFTLANRQIQRLLDYSEAELLELTVADLHPAADLPAVLEQFEKQARGEITLAPGIPVRRKDGTVFYADISAAAVRLRQRDCLLGVFRDITERKRAEEKIQSQLSELQRWQDVMLGREDRVRELKHEVNELCRRLREPVRYQSQEGGPGDSPKEAA